MRAFVALRAQQGVKPVRRSALVSGGHVNANEPQPRSGHRDGHRSHALTPELEISDSFRHELLAWKLAHIVEW
jgi:hypothetical protein